MRRLYALLLALCCGGCINPLGRELGEVLQPGRALGELRRDLWLHGVFQVWEENESPNWEIVYFEGILYGQPSSITVLFESKRARLVMAEAFMRGHQPPPWMTLSQCLSVLAGLDDGLQVQFGGASPRKTLTDGVETHTWSAPGRYALARFDFMPPDECESITVTLFDGSETELDAFLARLSTAEK